MSNKPTLAEIKELSRAWLDAAGTPEQAAAATRLNDAYCRASAKTRAGVAWTLSGQVIAMLARLAGETWRGTSKS